MAGIGKYKGKGEFKMKGYSPYDGSSFKMKKYNSPAYQKQEDWEPAYEGADYSKEELAVMSADERATAEGQAKLLMLKGMKEGEKLGKVSGEVGVKAATGAGFGAAGAAVTDFLKAKSDAVKKGNTKPKKK